MDSPHAILAPSSMARIVQCPWSAMQAYRLPPLPRTPEQIEGDEWHALALAYTQGTAAEHEAATPEMHKGAQLWLDTVGMYGVAEMPVRMEGLHSECWGTPDWRRFDPIDGLLRLWDFKGGFIPVHAEENWQCITYAYGVLDELGFLERLDLPVEIGIVQPRNYSDDAVSRWPVTVAELHGYWAVVRRACIEAMGPTPSAHVGPECLYCPVRDRCPTLQGATNGVLRFAGGGDPVNLSPRALGAELVLLEEATELLEARATGLKAQVDQMLRSGQSVPGWTLGRGRSSTKWLPSATPDVLQLLGVPGEWWPKTPKQAADDGVDPTVISEYAETIPGAIKIKRDDGAEARKLFGGNK